MHPRACGERSLPVTSMRSGVGASPRMRGTVGSDDAGHVGDRCIPAHAGNGRRTGRGRSGTSVHPRACGERAMRDDWMRSELRCIPAHAGNGRRFGGGSFAAAVHPRACGERVAELGPAAVEAGASPRMRGTGAIQPVAPTAGRCIPAHAGNGHGAGAGCHVDSVHPRACGERLPLPAVP